MAQRVVRTVKKKKIRKTVLLILIAIIAIVSYGIYMAVTTYMAASNSYDDLGREKSALRDEAVSIRKDPVSILIMGVEDYSSDGDHGRTDTLMLATFSPNDERLKLLSIPRDTLVDIVGRDQKSKINHAYAFGGKKMTIETVEQLLDIPIDYYATVNFDAFKNIVDILGGITVDVPFSFEQNSDDRKAEKLQFTEGQMDLDGRHALAFARMRMSDPRGDIGRNERQQTVIKAIIEKAVSPSSITKIDDIVEVIGDNVETNMRIREGLAFYKTYSDFKTSQIDQITFQTMPERINGISYQVADEASLEEAKTILKQHLEIDGYSPDQAAP
ncbi:LytR family transcriptional regulator [Ornithinibacillus gellani]|uniref:LCP family protein n=1 Tax=Ornithinibacillus gellani TaxID=2293253 RepID=UPI000F476E5F|nr:LCP family protein [Ornithinibacillus gellani]TQS75942.1 LytR family transcriptional regulator [Ornithinibacillus gellani]